MFVGGPVDATPVSLVARPHRWRRLVRVCSICCTARCDDGLSCVAHLFVTDSSQPDVQGRTLIASTLQLVDNCAARALSRAKSKSVDASLACADPGAGRPGAAAVNVDGRYCSTGQQLAASSSSPFSHVGSSNPTSVPPRPLERRRLIGDASRIKPKAAAACTPCGIPPALGALGLSAASFSAARRRIHRHDAPPGALGIGPLPISQGPKRHWPATEQEIRFGDSKRCVLRWTRATVPTRNRPY